MIGDDRTLFQALRARSGRPSAPAVRYRRRGQWHAVTWAELDASARAIAAALRARGAAACVVATAGRQHPAMVAWDLGVQGVRGATLALPPVLTAAEAAAALAREGATIVLCGDAGLAAALGGLPAGERDSLALIVVPDGTPIVQGPVETVELSAFAPAEQALAWADLPAGEPSDRAFVGFSAGAVEDPRPVAWAQGQALAAASSAAAGGLVVGDDEVLAHLPFGHPAGRILGLYAPLLVGATVVFPESGESLVEDMVTRSPTVVVTTARLPELLMARHEVRLRGSRRGRRSIARWALRSLDAGVERRGLRARLAMAIVGRPVRRQMGLARTRVIHTLFEPVSPATTRSFAALGVEISAPAASADAGVVVDADESRRPDDRTLLEAELRSSPYVSRAVVDDGGDGRPRAYVELAFETSAAWAHAADVPHTSYRSLVEHPRVLELLRGEVEARGLPASSLVLAPREFDLGRGELSWLGLPRRRAVVAALSLVDSQPVEAP